MLRPTEDVLRALIGLQGNPNWERVLYWIKESYDLDMASMGDNTVFRAGMAGELYDLLKNIHEARMNLDKLLKAQKQG